MSGHGGVCATHVVLPEDNRRLVDELVADGMLLRMRRRGRTPARASPISNRWSELKRLAIRRHDHARELDFFRGEVLARRWVDDRWYHVACWVGIFYGLYSDFGRSIPRLLLWWAAAIPVFAVIYLAVHVDDHRARYGVDAGWAYSRSRFSDGINGLSSPLLSHSQTFFCYNSPMIHEIRISNFYSIRDELVLDLRIPGTSPDIPRFRQSRSREDVRLPTVVALFGANASGKSTLLRAITSLVRFVCLSFDNPIEAGIPDMVAFMSREAWSEPTRFRFEFDARWFLPDGEEAADLFRYELVLAGRDRDDPALPGLGGATDWVRSRVLSESLHVSPSARPTPTSKKARRTWQRIFERREGEKTLLSDRLGLRPSDDRLSAVRDNASLISTLAKLNVEWAQAIYHDLLSLQSNIWGLNRAVGATQETDQNLWKYYQANPVVLDQLNRELRRFDTGIEKIEVILSDRDTFARFHHYGLDMPVLFAEESSGTQHAVRMFPQLHFVLNNGHIAVLDEFDSDLHPTLVPELFRWFQDLETNPLGAQLLVTAHNVQLMDHLEKEEVVLVEKDRAGRTTATPALDFKGLRREPRMPNVYMSGSLGAIPKIG